jgi:hypothetical protein
VSVELSGAAEFIESGSSIWSEYSFVPVLGLIVNGLTDSAKSNLTMPLTQLWLEVEYGDFETIFIKEKGVWNGVSCIVYQK